MRITVAAVGRARKGPERALYDLYAGRLSASSLASLTLKEVEERRPLPPDRLKRREAELLLAAIPEGASLYALDAGGRTLTSEAFAERLQAAREAGVQDLAFVVGGAEGLDPQVLERAGFVLSLGPMTWPHLLVRALLAEQLYRAQSILTGHPYHRGCCAGSRRSARLAVNSRCCTGKHLSLTN